MQPDIFDSYDYLAFVDASGDDGFKFKDNNDGSSLCYAVSVFLIKKEDLSYNMDVLNRIKSLVGCKPEHELKYTKLRRHRRSVDVHNEISNFKGTVVSWVAFKKRITDPLFLDVNNKTLPQFCHAFPLKALTSLLQEESLSKKVYIAVDVMKKIEMDGVSTLIEMDDLFRFDENGNQKIEDYTLKFKDSKDRNFQLIQAADIFSGIIRTSFEDYEIKSHLLNKCPLCIGKSLKIKKRQTLCIKDKNVFIATGERIRKIIHLIHRDREGKIVLNGITPYPFELSHSIRFIDCIIAKNK